MVSENTSLALAKSKKRRVGTRKGEKDGADDQELTASSREEFFKDCKSGGKYDGIVGIYRHNDSASTVGVFDKEFIEGLPESVKYICHNGAGYDQSESPPVSPSSCFLPFCPGFLARPVSPLVITQ